MQRRGAAPARGRTGLDRNRRPHRGGPAGRRGPVRPALGLQFAGLYLPFLQELLHTQPLTAFDLAVVFAAATLGYAAVRLDRILFRRKRTGDSPADQEPSALPAG